MRKPRILVVDDEEDICHLLVDTLATDQYNVEWTTRPFEALERVKTDVYELVLLDIKMPEISGLDLLPRLKKASPETAVMIMSAYGNVSMAVQAMKSGAEDYLEKPFRDLEEVRLSVLRLLETAQIRTENRLLRQQLEEKFQLDGLVSSSRKMQEVFLLTKKIAPLSTTVLITGETGTGKELIARTLHQNSHRSAHPFISVNCGGLPEGLLESLLFGHEKGAFTGAVRRTRGYFEEADGGSLFLDEVAETPAALQIKLLRVLQERTFQRVGGTEEMSTDVRLIAATNKDLEKEVSSGGFRQDLFYRLNVIAINLPPLRDRREDIPLLARHFVDKYCNAFKRPTLEITPEAIHYLRRHEWPGNVRQLENAIERAVALAVDRLIGPEAFIETDGHEIDDWMVESMRVPLREARRLFEKHYLLDNLRRHNGNVTQAARSARIPRQNYHRKLRQLGLPSSRELQELLSEVEADSA